MGDALRFLAFDGPLVGSGTLVALAWLIVRLESTRSENAAAHAAITRNIDGLKEHLTKELDGLKEHLTKELDGLKEASERARTSGC